MKKKVVFNIELKLSPQCNANQCEADWFYLPVGKASGVLCYQASSQTRRSPCTGWPRLSRTPPMTAEIFYIINNKYYFLMR